MTADTHFSGFPVPITVYNWQGSVNRRARHLWPSPLVCPFVPEAQCFPHIHLFTESRIKYTYIKLYSKGFSVLLVCCRESLGADQEQLHLREWFPGTYSQILLQRGVQGQCQFNVERSLACPLSHLIIGNVQAYVSAMITL